MKKITFLIVLAYFIIPAHVFAQYSNASLTGPYIVDGQQPTFIIFDGNGTIIQLGTSDDSLQPVGTYSVTSPGVITASVNLIQGTQTVTGKMLNDSSADLVVSGVQDLYAYQVLNPAALEGVWNGYITYNNGTPYTRDIQLTVNSSGVITSATGIPLVAGKMFFGRDTFCGYITTTDDSCPLTAIQVSGTYTGDSLQGVAGLGAHNSNCQATGTISLGLAPTGIKAVKPADDFMVYPNPFTDQVEIVVSNPTGRTQIDIYDLCGRKVYAQTMSDASKTSLDLSSIGSGMYMLTLTDESGHSATKKIVKN